jgi:lipase chaperone LimK
MKLKRTHLVLASFTVVIVATTWVMQTHGQAVIGAMRSPSFNTWFGQGKVEVLDHASPTKQAEQFQTGIEHLPQSLRGTDVPDELAEDAAGNLKLAKGVRDTFDYFLSAGGEEPDASIRSRIKAYIESHLNKKAAAQAVALLDIYIDYKNKLQLEYSKTPGQNVEDIGARMAVAKQLRAQMFTRDVYDAFFADDDAFDEFGLARFATLQDSSLSASAKAQKIAEARSRLPEALQKTMNAIEVVQTLDAVTGQWAQQGGTPQQLRAIREQLVGPEAATRLEALDKRVAEWDARVQNYLGQRDAIRNNSALSEAMKDEQIGVLQKGFTKPERVRIDALERIHDTGGVDPATDSGS